MSYTLLQEALNKLIGARLPEPLICDGIVGKKTTLAYDTLAKASAEVFKKKGYVWSAEANLIAIRVKTDRQYKFSNRFVDIGLITIGDVEICFPMSSVAGLYGKGNVLSPIWIDGVYGVGVVKEGQYKGAYSLNSAWWSGLKFLMQVEDFDYYRDGNLDTKLNRLKVYRGKKGFNFHSWRGFVGAVVNNLSQGCMVTEQAVWTNTVLPLLERVAVIYKNKIDFTLINEDDFYEVK